MSVVTSLGHPPTYCACGMPCGFGAPSPRRGPDVYFPEDPKSKSISFAEAGRHSILLGGRALFWIICTAERLMLFVCSVLHLCMVGTRFDGGRRCAFGRIPRSNGFRPPNPRRVQRLHVRRRPPGGGTVGATGDVRRRQRNGQRVGRAPGNVTSTARSVLYLRARPRVTWFSAPRFMILIFA